jgi:hypothetical protein
MENIGEEGGPGDLETLSENFPEEAGEKYDKIQGGLSPGYESGAFRTRSSNARHSVSMKRSRHRFHRETC